MICNYFNYFDLVMRASSLLAFRCYFELPSINKDFTIIGDSAFTEANQVLDAFVKDLRKTGKIAGVVHKKPITKQQIQRLYECGELGPANSTTASGLVLPCTLFWTAWT